MRKLWFAHLAKALIVFPGGFGTLDELTEIITLAQTKKLERQIPILLYGESYWNEIINFKALLRHQVIGADDLNLLTSSMDPTPPLPACCARSNRTRRRKLRRSHIRATQKGVDHQPMCSSNWPPSFR